MCTQSGCVEDSNGDVLSAVDYVSTMAFPATSLQASGAPNGKSRVQLHQRGSNHPCHPPKYGEMTWIAFLLCEWRIPPEQGT